MQLSSWVMLNTAVAAIDLLGGGLGRREGRRQGTLARHDHRELRATGIARVDGHVLGRPCLADLRRTAEWALDDRRIHCHTSSE
jgi:hypothetical protein